MADLTARFGADFGSFKDAIDQATVTLKGLETGAGRVETSLNAMVDKFSGRKLIQDAELMVAAIEEIGGVSKLTEEELDRMGTTAAAAIEKMNAIGMGDKVSQGMRDLATHTKAAGSAAETASPLFATLARYAAGFFTVTAVINFAKEVLAAGDAIQKAADQTGMLTDEVQQLQYIAGQTGTEFGSLVAASQNLSAALGRNDEGVIDGIEKLGINLSTFMRLRPQAQLFEIADAIRAMGNSTEQAAAAQAIFGPKWRDMMAAIEGGMKGLADEAPKMSASAVRGLDAMGDAWDRLYRTAIANTGEMIDSDIKLVNTIVTNAERMVATLNALPALVFGVSATEIKEQGDAYAAAIAKATAALKPHDGALKAVGITSKEVADATEALDKSIKKQFEDRDRKAAEDYAKALADGKKILDTWFDAQSNVAAATSDYREALATLDPRLVAHLETLIRAGVKVEELTTAYGLSSQVSKALTLDIRDQDAAQQKANESREAMARLELQYTSAVRENMDLGKSATDQKIADINRWADATILANAKVAGSEELINQTRKERIEAAKVDERVLAEASQSHLRETADRAQATYEYMIAHSERYASEAIIHQQDVATAASIAADVWEQTFTKAGDAAGRAGEDAARRNVAAAQQVSLSWSQAMDAVRAGQGTMSGSTNAFAGTRAQVQQAFDEHGSYGPVAPGGFGGVHPDWEALGFSPTGSGSDLPGRAAGGPVSGGNPYLVGERGPELFVPDRGGTVVPNGAGGSVVNNFYVNGTGQDVARIINAELTRQMRVGRKWPSV